MYHLVTDGDKGDLYLLGIVKGLVDEADKLENKISDIDFKLGALPISDDELDGIKKFSEGEYDDVEIEPSKPEKIYANNLSRFGEVSLPPPSYIRFLKFCEDKRIEVRAVDMDEDHYTMAYCEHVSGTQWLFQSFREKRLESKKFNSETPKKFAVEWDRVINKLSGYRELEEHREEVMSKNLTRLSMRGNILFLVEFERMEGVIKNLKEKGWRESP